MKRVMIPVVAMIALLTLSACGVFSDDAVASLATQVHENTAMADGDTPAEAAAVAYNGPAWATLELVNARTGEAFTMADFAGQAVYVEPMATWCSNCRNKQRQVVAAQPELPEDVVLISLSVENGLSNERLASYADQNGFNWIFAVVTPEMLTALVEQFGRGVSVPPSMPHFTIAPDGTVSQLFSGMSGADEIVAELTALVQ